MANYPPYGYNTPQMAQGQPMMGPQGQPGYIPQQIQQMPQQHQQMAPEPRYIVRPVASEMEAMAAPAPAEPVEQYAPMSAVDQLRRELEALRAELPGTKSAPVRGGKKEATEV